MAENLRVCGRRPLLRRGSIAANWDGMTDAVQFQTVPGHDGLPIAVHSLGAGRTAVLLHGLSSNAQINWIKFGHAAAITQAGFHVVMIDARAHGRSAAPHDPAAYPRDVMALDTQAVLRALGVSDFDLVGYSMGSRLAINLIGLGARPRRLVLGGMGLEGLGAWTRRRAFFLAALEHFETARRGDADYLAIQFMKTVGIDPVALRLLLMSTDDLPADMLDPLNMPTLVLSGDQDEDNGSARALADALVDADYEEVPGTHMSCITKPDFGQAIAAFLAA